MKKLIITGLFLNLAVLGGYIYDRLNSSKTGFIVIQEVFNAFELKKDYERKLLSTKNQRDKITDSLALELRILAKRIDEAKTKNKEDISLFELKREDFIQKKKRFEEDNSLQTKRYDQEIITQLNQYVRDYGKEKGYTYILGNDGNGSLMYATDAKNLTKEVIAYINAKYKGVN